MDSSPGSPTLRRLGGLLANRRGQIGFRLRAELAATTELSEKTLARLERGERYPSRPSSQGEIEAAYKLAPGSLNRSLASGQLESADAGEVEQTQALRRGNVVILPTTDAFEQAIMDSDLPPAEKFDAIQVWRDRGKQLADELLHSYGVESGLSSRRAMRRRPG